GSVPQPLTARLQSRECSQTKGPIYVTRKCSSAIHGGVKTTSANASQAHWISVRYLRRSGRWRFWSNEDWLRLMIHSVFMNAARRQGKARETAFLVVAVR